MTLNIFTLFYNPLKIDGCAHPLFSKVSNMGNKSGFDLHHAVFKRNSSIVHMRGTRVSLLKLATHLTWLRLGIFFDDIRIITEPASLGCCEN